jgi:hypothetical protein
MVAAGLLVLARWLAPSVHQSGWSHVHKLPDCARDPAAARNSGTFAWAIIFNVAVRPNPLEPFRNNRKIVARRRPPPTLFNEPVTI